MQIQEQPSPNHPLAEQDDEVSGAKIINHYPESQFRRILLGPPKWQKAREEFKEICKNKGIDPKEYGSKFARSPAEAIEAILEGTFDDKTYFKTPEERRNEAMDRVDQMLKENRIDPGTYEEKYGHKKIDLLYLFLTGQEPDTGFWCTAKNPDKYAEARRMFASMCKERGIDIDSYPYEYRIAASDAHKYIHRHLKEISEGSRDALEKVEARVFTKNPDPKRTKEWIFQAAKSKVPPGRTAGLTMLELGKIKSLAKAFYPGGMNALNSDLGLEQTVHIPDYGKTRELAPTTTQIRIEEVNRKIDRLCEQLDPRRLARLQDELHSLQHETDELQGDQYDSDILEKLEEEIERSLQLQPGYLYLKQWALPDATWFKIGITNSPSRRDSEQNVLPVPAQTVYLVRLDSMEHARATEKAFHKILKSKRIEGAMNKEIFQLSPRDYRSVVMAMKGLADRFAQPDPEE
jgi:hypothetical protein